MPRPMDFDVTEAIALRHSVRTFDSGKRISDAMLQTLLQTAKEAPNPFGISGFNIVATRKSVDENAKIGTYGVVKGADTFLGLGVDGSEMSCLAGAYSLETAVLQAASKGLGTVWLGGTLKRKSFFEAFGFNAPTVLPAVTAIGYPAPKRIAEKAFRFFAKSDSRKPWESLFFENDMHTPLAKEASTLCRQALDNLRLAPSALNGQPWRVIKQGCKYHFCAEIPSSLSGMELMLKYIDMGIAICHFHLTLLQENVACAFVNDPPDTESPANWRYVTTCILM